MELYETDLADTEQIRDKEEHKQWKTVLLWK
jgi:hypothetical protein